MRFAACLADVPCVAVRELDVDITSVEYDSRRVGAGSLFVAMQGGTADGNRFVEKAILQGAVAVVTDSASMYQQLVSRRDVAVAQVESGRRALAAISANFYGHPEKKLSLSAVTGTNGKTTTAFLLEGLLRASERQTVLIGTVETHIAGAVRPSPHTTPEGRDVLAVFAEGVQAGATEAVMEMSSHALEQERVWGIPVDVAVFTNLTQDHLDYHKTMDAYADAKARLFEGVGAAPPRVAVLNADDAYFTRMREAAKRCEIAWSYGLAPQADFYATELMLSAGKTSFTLRTPFGEANVRSQLTGRINVYNLTAAIAAAIGRGLSLSDAVKAAEDLRAVPGRFETVANAAGITVVVDYAHTDDALANLLSIARELLPKGKRIITIFGCGGDRDRTKRPKMGRTAGRQSDFVIVTSDNPRSEDPAAIAEEVLQGLLETDVEHVVELDRHAAIEKGIRMARPGDMVLIAGKGHEKEQVLRDRTVPFDDVEVAAQTLRALEGRA